MPLPTPQPVTNELLLAPGQRIDLFVDVTADVGESAHLLRVDDEKGVSQVAFPVLALGTRARRGTPKPLPANPDQEVTGLDDALRARLNMAGGAMGSLDAAILQGERKTFQSLVQANQFWAFNRIIGMTETPLLTADLGQTVRLEIFNDTVFPHAMHMHGTHFREVLKNGALGPLRDTLLTFGGDTREVAFMVNNPGDWLFHCHMLSHADSGMMTWLKVNT